LTQNDETQSFWAETAGDGRMMGKVLPIRLDLAQPYFRKFRDVGASLWSICSSARKGSTFNLRTYYARLPRSSLHHVATDTSLLGIVELQPGMLTFHMLNADLISVETVLI
jgi:hypothetical protein